MRWRSGVQPTAGPGRRGKDAGYGSPPAPGVMPSNGRNDGFEMAGRAGAVNVDSFQTVTPAQAGAHTAYDYPFRINELPFSQPAVKAPRATFAYSIYV